MKKPKVCDHGVVSPHICDECVKAFAYSFHLGDTAVSIDMESDGEFLEHMLTPDEFTGYCIGTAAVLLRKVRKDYSGEALRDAILHLRVLQDYLS